MSPPSRPQRTTRIRRLAALVVLTLLGAGLLAVPATAAPSPEQVEAAIDKQWEQLEPTIENYNKVRAQLKVNRDRAAALQRRIEPLALSTALVMNRIGDLAARQYMTGSPRGVAALLTTTRPGTLAEQLTILDRLAAAQRREVADVVRVRDRYEAEKQKLDALIATQAAQEKELAAKKTQINTEITRLRAMMPKTTVKVAGCPTVTGVIGTAAQTAIRVACQQVGDPYVWGATGPDGFDCSGLTQYAYKAAGISLTHFTGAQWNEGTPVSRAEARPGDLVFFKSDLSHMGLYLGSGLMVHAPRTGKLIQVSPISIMPLAGFRRPG
ncbi:C40 family peptidase [Micromonospora aurantiaca (nom. illeg.)]|uniref:C40 family peptidase n=1 Tax=Micromonospora aurantiaca (nom. illeg.) TaxID=47850 RepID=UPI003DA2E383